VPALAGKTTLIKTLLNIWRPDAGQAWLLGVESRRMGPQHLQQTGYVWERSDRIPSTTSSGLQTGSMLCRRYRTGRGWAWSRDASLAPFVWQVAGTLKARPRPVSLAGCFAIGLGRTPGSNWPHADHQEFREPALGP